MVQDLQPHNISGISCSQIVADKEDLVPSLFQRHLKIAVLNGLVIRIFQTACQLSIYINAHRHIAPYPALHRHILRRDQHCRPVDPDLLQR